MTDVSVTTGDDFVATVEVHRPPANYFDADMIGGLADAYEQLQANGSARAIVLSTEGRHFCAGAQLARED